MQLPDLILDWFFPRRCLLCGREGAWACNPCCVDAAVQVGEMDCWELQDGTAVTGLLPFELPLVRELLHNLKYNGIYEAAEALLGLLKYCYEPGEIFQALRDTADSDRLVLIPVPVSRQRLRDRGYNQASKLAETLGGWLDLPVWPGALLRHPGKSQVGRSASERQAALAGAFKWANQAKYPGLSPVIIDDLCTTGSTLAACLQALPKHLNAQGLAFARKH